MTTSRLARQDQELSPTVQSTGAIRARPLVIKLHGGGIILALYLTLPFYKPALQSYFPIDLTAVAALLSSIFAIPATLTVLAGKSSIDRGQRRFIALWFGVMLLIWLGALYAPNQHLAVQQALLLTATVLIPLLLVLRVASDEGELGQFLTTIFCVGLVSTALVGSSGLVSSDSLYRTSFFGASPINTAISVLMVPAIGFSYLWERSQILRLVVLVVSPVSVLIAFTSARGPLVTLLIALALLFMLRVVKSLSRMTVYVLGVVLVIIVFDAFIAERLPAFGVTRFQGLSDSVAQMLAGNRSNIDDASVGVRLDLFEVALDMFQRSPIFGVGTYSFPVETSRIPGMGDLEYPHNIVLQFLAEYGLLGLSVFILLTYCASTVARQMSHPAIFGLATIYLSALLEAMISGGLENRLFWGVMFLSIAVSAGGSLSLDRSAVQPGTNTPGPTTGFRH